MRIAICVSGRGSNMAALLDALRGEPQAAPVLVLSNRADAPALELARERGVTAEGLDNWKSGAEWLERLARHQVDLIVLAGFLKLVPAEVIAAYRGRILNVHPALLPAFGGPGMFGHHVHEAVIASGATHSGATVHLVDEHYDEGAILAQARVPVLPGDTSDSLARRVLSAEHVLLPAVVLAAARAGHPIALPEPLALPA